MKTEIIAELGINHNGKIEVAKTLISAAAEAGVTGVKFQYRNLNNSYSNDSKEIGDEILREEIFKNYLSPDSINTLVDYAKTYSLKVGISFFNTNDIMDFKDSVEKFDFFKVPSVEFQNYELIKRLMELNRIVYLSLGCQTEHEIEEILKKIEGCNYCLLHCVSNYPVETYNTRLGYINYFKRKYDKNIGYSSHDKDWEVCLFALQLGVNVIERHITLDKSDRGLDHSSSSTPNEFKRIVHFSNVIDDLLKGCGPRSLNQGEKLNLQNLGRSYYAKKRIIANSFLKLEDIELKSPQIGLGTNNINDFIGKKIINSIEAGKPVSMVHFSKNESVEDVVIDFARIKKICLPVRLHDYLQIRNKFPINGFEFHLSFTEVINGLHVNQINSNSNYSVHLPDYINSTQLIDPFSTDANQKMDSLIIIDKTIEFAKKIQDITGKEVPVVGSFSIINKNHKENYANYKELVSNIHKGGVLLLPQWLPPIAWYFGGSIKIDSFNKISDALEINKLNLNICMDLCHLFMGEAFFNFSANDVYNQLSENIKHIHIADSIGIDGEGIQFGDGEPKNMPLILNSLDFNALKVIEVWQGHLNQGHGFAVALNKLYKYYNSIK